MLVSWFILDRVGLGLEELRQAGIVDWRPRLPLFLASCAALMAGYALSAMIWARMVVDLGGPRLGAFESVRLFMIANLGRYVPGKVWQIAGLAALATRRGVPARTATGSAVLGQGIALVAATAIGLGALLGAPAGGYRTAGQVAAGVMALAIVLMAVPSVFRRGAEFWFRIARTEEPARLESAHGLRWLAAYGANWALYALSFGLFVASFEPEATLMPVASAFAAAYVLGYVAIFAPAGLGIRESALVVFLTPHLGLGPAGGIAILARLWTTAVEVVPAGAFWAHYVATSAGEGTDG